MKWCSTNYYPFQKVQIFNFYQYKIFHEIILGEIRELIMKLHKVSIISSFFTIADSPDPAGTGGSSNTGNRARDFFRPKNRDAMRSLWKVRNWYLIIWMIFKLYFSTRLKVWPLKIQILDNFWDWLDLRNCMILTLSNHFRLRTIKKLGQSSGTMATCMLPQM